MDSSATLPSVLLQQTPRYSSYRLLGGEGGQGVVEIQQVLQELGHAVELLQGHALDPAAVLDPPWRARERAAALREKATGRQGPVGQSGQPPQS